MLCEWMGSIGVECLLVCICGEFVILKMLDLGFILLLGGFI